MGDGGIDREEEVEYETTAGTKMINVTCKFLFLLLFKLHSFYVFTHFLCMHALKSELTCL